MFNSNKYFSQSLQNAFTDCRIEEMLSKVYLKTAVTKPLTTGDKGNGIAYAVCSVQGWRRYQEDSHITEINFDDQHSMFAVFDGHNGPEVAVFASKQLPKLIKENKNFQIGNIEFALQEVFMTFDALLLTKEANQQLLELRKTVIGAENISPNDRPGVSSGCTALVVLIKSDMIYVANIGDSRCVLSRNGKAVSLSNDHKPEDRSERKRIERSGGQVIEGRINGGLNLSRAFGDHQYKRNKYVLAKDQMVSPWPEVRVKRIKAKKEDFLVIACDGVWNCLSNQKVVNFVAKQIKSKKLTTICEEVTQKCLSPVRPLNGIGGDNTTCILVKFSDN